MLADISSSAASKNGMTLEMLADLQHFLQVLAIKYLRSKRFFFFSPRFSCHFLKNLTDSSWNKVHINSGKACIPETCKRALSIQYDVGMNSFCLSSWIIKNLFLSLQKPHLCANKPGTAMAHSLTSGYALSPYMLLSSFSLQIG